MNLKKPNIPITIALIVLVLSIGANFALATKDSPYISGYKHGCDDAQIKVFDDRYINQPGKGKSHHTDAFMDGYFEGLKDCTNKEDSFTESDRHQHHVKSGYEQAQAFFDNPKYSTVSNNDDDNDEGDRSAHCNGWENGKNVCYVDGKQVILDDPNYVETITQAQSSQQKITCITIFSVCGNNNQQNTAAATSLD